MELFSHSQKKCRLQYHCHPFLQLLDSERSFYVQPELRPRSLRLCTVAKGNALSLDNKNRLHCPLRSSHEVVNTKYGIIFYMHKNKIIETDLVAAFVCLFVFQVPTGQITSSSHPCYPLSMQLKSAFCPQWILHQLCQKWMERCSGHLIIRD